LPESSTYGMPAANENAPVSRSVGRESDHTGGTARNTGDGRNKGSDIQWPPPEHEFWTWPQEGQIEFILSRQADQRFDQERDRYFAEPNREYTPLLKEAIEGLAYSMLRADSRAYQALRDGRTEVVEPYLEEALKVIQKIATDNRDHKPGRDVDRVIENLG